MREIRLVLTLCETYLRGRFHKDSPNLGLVLGLALSDTTIDRSIRLRPRRTCELEHVSLSNAFLHNLLRAPSIRARLSYLICWTFIACSVVIGQFTRGRSLMDRSIGIQPHKERASKYIELPVINIQFPSLSNRCNLNFDILKY